MAALCGCRAWSARDARSISSSPPAEECAAIGLCERLVEPGRSREAAEAWAHKIDRFPQACMRADRRSAIAQTGLPVRAALEQEFAGGLGGGGRFVAGAGRHGDFSES